MKIAEVLTESKQLDEGPILNKIGTAVGKGVGALGKGVGAAIGGAVGLGKAIKKGYQAGKSVVGQAGDDEEPAAKPAAAADAAAPDASAPQAQQPADTGATAAPASTTTPPSTTQINKAGPKGAPMAKPVQGTQAKQAVAKTTAATAQQAPDQAAATMYSQIKANIEKLDKKGKQRLLTLLQKSIQQHGSRTPAAPATGQPTPAVGAQATAPATQPTASAAPVAQPAQATAPTAGVPAAKKGVKIASKKKAPAAPIKPAAQPQTASIVHNGKVIAESFSLFRKS